MKKMKYMAIFVILLISGNFLRLFLEEGNKPEIKMGSGKGNLNIPYSVYENLKRRFNEKNK